MSLLIELRFILPLQFMENIHQYNANVKKRRKENNYFFAKIKKRRPKDLDDNLNDLHEKQFEKTDCLTCANCCKTTPSLLTRLDIKRISKHLGMKVGKFTEEYLRLDEDDDYVFKHTPCSFLNEDNTCQIYNERPRSCKGYPYTDSYKVNLNVMEKNIAVCPAVYEITEELKRVYIVLSTKK